MPRKPKKSILEYYPYPTFRHGHREFLLALEKNWKEYQIFIVVAAPGVGKTALRRTIAYWAADSVMTVPTNNLLGKELEDYPSTRKILGRDQYETEDEYFDDLDSCSRRGRPVLCVPHSVIAKRYNRHRRPIFISRKTFIADEAHRYIALNQELQATYLWRRDFQYPPYIYDRKSLEQFLKFTKQTKKVQTIIQKLLTNNYMIKREKGLLRGKWEDRISLIPLFPDPHAALFRSPDKLVFMSATINELDVFDLGISKEAKILKLELPSIIPPARRPVIPLDIGNINYGNLKQMAPRIVEYIKDIANFHTGKKGLVHATYSTAAAIRPLLYDDPRFILHTADDSKRQFELWQESADKIFIASGYEEGIDLLGDEYEWQILTRIPWPSLADPAISKKSSIAGQAWYIWQALKATIQATGRICRDPTDYGVTYILDSNWDRLIKEGTKHRLIPDFFSDILQ